MKLKIFFISVFLISTSFSRGAPQEQKLTGTVTDAVSGEPLPGVNVVVEGTTTGVSTDSNGKYNLPKPVNGAILIFSFVGYNGERITYSGEPVVDVMLSRVLKVLDDVVVIGYGTIRKSDLTGSIASVSAKDIEKSTPVNIQSVLQGRVPGIVATATSGAPWSEAFIRIRGIGTVNNNDPVYVVDGTIIDNTDPNNPASNIRFLNPWDIERIEVLKDASAQAIYGSRGANGVILITTKKGSEGMPKVTFTSSTGFNNITKKPEVLNRDEFYDYVLTCYSNGYIRTHPGSSPVIPIDTLKNTYKTVRQVAEEYEIGIYTDWPDEVLNENVMNQNYNLLISGGTKYSHYSASAGYVYSEGLISKYNNKRYSFRLNTDYSLGKFITVGENVGISSEKQNGFRDYGPSFQSAMESDPLAPVLKPEGSVDPDDPDYRYNKYAASGITGDNPVLMVDLMNWKNSLLTLAGNIFGEAKIIKDLTFRSSYGFNIAYSDITEYSPKYNNTTLVQENSVSKVSNTNYRTNGWIWENTLTYSKIIKNHSITALLGYTSEYTHALIQNASKQGTPNNDPEMQTFDAATINSNITGGYNVVAMASYIGRVNYSYEGRYLLTASVRHDGSSRFAERYRWGTFPSFALGWNIHKEEFFKNVIDKYISNLKLRAGWGQIGNSSLPVNSAYVSQVSSGWTDGWLDNRYIFGETVYTGYFYKTIGTPDITWETTEQMNFGIDLGLLKNSLNLTADYFVKLTKDMLLQIPNPKYVGYPWTAEPYTNAGSVQNSGFELLAEYKGKSGDLSYNLSINAATFRNKVTSLGNGNKPIIYGINRTEVGKPMAGFYGFIINGIFQSEYSVQSETGVTGQVMQPDAHAGDFRFLDLNADGKIDSKDETWIGDPWPKLTYGFNIILGYKPFDLLLFLQGSYGNDLYSTALAWQNPGSGNVLKYIYEKAWRGPGTSDTDPILTSVNNNDNFRFSDYLVQDASYMRLKNLQVGFNIPEELCKKIKMSDCRFWIGGTNLFTVTKYPGIDPEVGTSSKPVWGEGWDWNSYFPFSREIILGINVSF